MFQDTNYSCQGKSELHPGKIIDMPDTLMTFDVRPHWNYHFTAMFPSDLPKLTFAKKKKKDQANHLHSRTERGK
jgi:hypothetical protein